MGSVKVLDTNAIIYLVNDRLSTILPAEGFLVSVISQIELLGWRNLGERDEKAIRKVLAEVTIVGLDETIVEKVIELRRSTTLRIPDAIVAATAVVSNAELITLDKAFASVPDLRIFPIELR